MQTFAFNVGSVILEGPRLVFDAIGITSEFVPKELLPQLAETSINKEIRWRHISPDIKPESYLGRILTARVQDSTMIIRGEIQGDTTEQLVAQRLILDHQANGQPLGVSMGYLEYTENQTGRITRVDAREASITPSPKCEVCRIFDIRKIANEIGEKRMSQPQATQEPIKTQEPKPIDLSQKVKELEGLLSIAQKERDALAEILQVVGLNNQKLEEENKVLRTFPVRKDIGVLVGLDGPQLDQKIRDLEKYPQDYLEVMRDMLSLKSGIQKPQAIQNQGVPSAVNPSPTPQPVTATLNPSPPIVSATSTPRQLDVKSMSAEDLAKYAEDFVAKHSKRIKY